MSFVLLSHKALEVYNSYAILCFSANKTSEESDSEKYLSLFYAYLEFLNLTSCQFDQKLLGFIDSNWSQETPCKETMVLLN